MGVAFSIDVHVAFVSPLNLRLGGLTCSSAYRVEWNECVLTQGWLGVNDGSLPDRLD
jgi:hypothetical protein